MTPLRILLRGFLAALLVLTSVGMGIGRGQAAVVDHVVLCGSFGTQVVAVDRNGTVVEAPGHCPDCAGLLLAPPLGVPQVQSHSLRALPVSLPRQQGKVRAGLGAGWHPPARAPPQVRTA